MQKRIFFILCLVCSMTAIGQGNFDDVYKSLQVNDRFSNMLNLRHYQQVDPERAITYFLLGDVFEKYLRETDPLKYFNDIDIYYSQATTYYGLLLAKLDDRQARQDREYFVEVKKQGSGKRLEKEDILTDVNTRLSDLSQYYEHAKTVHQNYVRFVGKYNECLFDYRQILTNYPRYKDLCLLITPELTARIEKINSNFAQAKTYFDTYREACPHFSHLFPMPRYTLKPIVTYRLEGLVESDYAAPVLELWDYSLWAESFLLVLKTDIQTIREQLLVVDSKLDKQINQLQNNEMYNDNMEVFKPDVRFKNLIGKYDNNSLVNKLLEYKESKIDFMQYSRKTINNPNDSAAVFLINRMAYYKDLAYMQMAVNEEAASLQKSVTIDDVGKYIAFFDSRYNGMDRFIRWCEVEKYNNSQWFNKNLLHLDAFLLREAKQNAYSGDNSILNKKKAIAMGVQDAPSGSFLTDTCITRFFQPVGKHSVVVAGYELSKDSVMNPFVAQSDTSRVVRWFAAPGFRTVKSDSMPVVVSEMTVADDSTIILLVTKGMDVDASSRIENYIVRYDWKGKEISRQLIDTLGVPVYFQFDEISGEYLLVTEQKSKRADVSESLLSVSLIPSSGIKNWVQHFRFRGSFVDVINTNSNFFLFLNAAAFQYDSGALFEAGNDTKCLGIYIDHDGRVRHYQQYAYIHGMQLTDARKINSNNFSLFGHTGSKNKNEGLFYLLIDPEGEILFKNLDSISGTKK